MYKKYFKIIIEIIVIFIISLLINVFLVKFGGEMGYRFISNTDNKPLMWIELYEARHSILQYTFLFTIIGIVGYYAVIKKNPKK